MGFFGFGDDEKVESIDALVNALPDSGTTVYALKALDFAVPGEWENIINFDEMLRKVTGESDGEFLNNVKRRALELYNDENEGYQTAVRIYQLVDNADSALGTAALANKLSQSFSMLSFLDTVTPKADNAQAVDLAIKIVAELIAFTKVNGLPGDSIMDFVSALGEYAGESKIRMAAIASFDGVLPLGPDFVNKAFEVINNLSITQLENNAIFQRISQYIPGSSVAGQLGFIRNAFDATRAWLNNFVIEHSISPEKIKAQLASYIDIADDKLDYVAGFIDVSTSYVEHTGIQTVAARLIERAVNEV